MKGKARVARFTLFFNEYWHTSVASIGMYYLLTKCESTSHYSFLNNTPWLYLFNFFFKNQHTPMHQFGELLVKDGNLASLHMFVSSFKCLVQKCYYWVSLSKQLVVFSWFLTLMILKITSHDLFSSQR